MVHCALKRENDISNEGALKKKGREGALPQFLALVLPRFFFSRSFLTTGSLEQASSIASASYVWYVRMLDILRFGCVPLRRIENA